MNTTLRLPPPTVRQFMSKVVPLVVPVARSPLPEEMFTAPLAAMTIGLGTVAKHDALACPLIWVHCPVRGTVSLKPVSQSTLVWSTTFWLASDQWYP